MRNWDTICRKAGAIFLAAGLGLSNAHGAAGDLYVSSFISGTIVKVPREGVSSPFAGMLSRPAGLAFDRAGNLFVAEGEGNRISRITPSGIKSTFAAGLNGPQSLAFDGAGNLFATDVNGNAIYKFAPDGTRTTFASNLNGPSGLAFNSAGELFESDVRGGTINKFSTTGTKTIFASGLDSPTGLAVDRLGNLLVAEFGQHRVVKFAADGTPVAFGLTTLDRPFSLAFDPAGTLFIADNAAAVVLAYTEDGTLTVAASDIEAPSGLALEPPTSIPLNIATRMQVLTGENVLIAGFILLGSEPKKVLIRGIGPSLSGFGIAGPLEDPLLELHDETGATIAANDDWRQTQEAEIAATGIPPTDNRESSIVRTLSPGSYTMIERGKGDGTGVGVVEVYDLERERHSSLANISTRGLVGVGSDVMIGGFIIGPGNGARVVLRALGPSLSAAGISNALADPTLELHDGNGALINGNDNWQQNQASEIRNTGVAPPNDLESAIVATLPPGSYTAIVAGAAGGRGVGLVELYNLP
jgi:sugar lactone lactonase YvrE